MKTIFSLLFLFVSFISFSQENKSIKSGYITFNSGTVLEFKNLVLDDENVVYISGEPGQEMKVSKRGVKKIVDSTGAVIYESGKVNEVVYSKIVDAPAMKADNEKLVYKSAYKIMQDGKRLSGKETEALMKSAGLHDLYKNGKENAEIGDILIGGGIGLFIGGGISNVIKANNNRSGGGPAILIVGLVATGIGIPIKISGAKKIKAAISQYNSQPAKSTASFESTDLKVIGNANGIGFQLRF